MRPLLLLPFLPALLAAQTITSPDQFFGFRLGSDKHMARWDKIVEYYGVLEKQSGGRMKVINMGPTSEGNPFLAVVITAPANMQKLEHYRDINLKLSDPRGLTEQQARAFAEEGKAVILQSMSMHATEIGGTQMAPELAFDLLNRKDEEARRILDNVIFIEVPCFNPDGEIMVTDWYNKQLGTPYEGSNPPWLYQKYAGHDNNRDAFQTNIPDSKYMAKLLFTEWKPEAYVDHHGMGPNQARIFLPPYAEPVRPMADPIVWRELAWYGAQMADKEEEAGLSGAINNAVYSGWGHFGFHWITPFHNIAGMLTESAASKLASPLYLDPDQLRGGARNMPTYDAETIFPNPWPGGWWHLRDIVDRQKVSAWATLDLAARNRETILFNAYLKAKRQTERGAAGKPSAYLVSAIQHDPLTSVKFINKLLVQGIEIQRAGKAFSTSNGMSYPAGSFVVSMAQPKMGLIRYLMGRTFFPDNYWTREKDGSPIRPYDMATDTMFEYMGVRVDPVDEPVEASLEVVKEPVRVVGEVSKSSNGYVLDGRLNDSFRAANLLFDKNVSLRRVDKGAKGLRPGDFLVPPGNEAELQTIARETGVDFKPLAAAVAEGVHNTGRLRIAMYQRYGGGNIDEGWTRFVLEEFKFPYKSIFDPEIKAGNLKDKYDVLIIPNDSTQAITGEAPPATAPAAGGGRGGRGGAGSGAAEGAAAPPAAQAAAGGRGAGGEGGRGGPTPPEYRTGLGTQGVNAIREFVQKGGTLVTFNAATAFPIDRLGIGVRNVLTGKTTKEFWCPGSTLKVTFDNTNPIAYGMPAKGLALFLNSPAFEITAQDAEGYETVARYAEREVLESGWLVGEENLARKSAVISAKSGEGRVVLIGFPAQHRAQMHSTYKLVFNTLVR